MNTLTKCPYCNNELELTVHQKVEGNIFHCEPCQKYYLVVVGEDIELLRED